MDKICTIINTQFSWVLDVDGYEIPFQYFINVEYFKKHYSELGYTIIMEDRRLNEK